MSHPANIKRLGKSIPFWLYVYLKKSYQIFYGAINGIMDNAVGNLTLQTKFKSKIRLLAFYFVLMPLGKSMNLSFLLPAQGEE